MRAAAVTSWWSDRDGPMFPIHQVGSLKESFRSSLSSCRSAAHRRSLRWLRNAQVLPGLGQRGRSGMRPSIITPHPLPTPVSVLASIIPLLIIANSQDHLGWLDLHSMHHSMPISPVRPDHSRALCFMVDVSPILKAPMSFGRKILSALRGESSPLESICNAEVKRPTEVRDRYYRYSHMKSLYRLVQRTWLVETDGSIRAKTREKASDRTELLQVVRHK